MSRFLRSAVVFGTLGAAALLGVTLGGAQRPPLNFYEQRNLVSDGFIHAEHTDPHLVNGWGIQFNPAPNGLWWVNDADTGFSTLYDANGNANSLVVTVPPGTGESGNTGHPTGIVFNAGNGFVVTDGTNTAPARFIFATENGTIAAWAPTVPPPAPATVAHTVFPAAGDPSSGAIFKGLALANNGQGDFLYATDFHNARIDVFDSSFHLVTLAGDFTDPNLPARFAPFGIRAINDVLFVTFAMQDDDAEDDVAGRGLGIVDAFDLSGHLLRRMITGGKLNAPWGLALSPSDFGKFSNSLLVGNFGDGHINAYNPINGSYRGTLLAPRGGPIQIDGLWGISFGNDNLAGPANVLFFASGPGGESHGLFGSLTAVANGRGHGR
jgi:uncharacterized protein (TIGR03118 family)